MSLETARKEFDSLNEFEQIIVQWQYRLYGKFHTALFEAIIAADEPNLAKLERGFPKEVHAFRLWKTTWIAQDLRERGILD